jgi:hypothetical protein
VKVHRPLGCPLWGCEQRLWALRSQVSCLQLSRTAPGADTSLDGVDRGTYSANSIELQTDVLCG